MREIEKGLTRQVSHPTLGSEGRFMPNEAGDVQIPPPEPAMQQVPAEAKPVKSWEMWGSYLEDKKGRPLSKAEKRVLDMAAELKVEWWKDPSEVEDPEKETSWQTNKTREFIIRFGDELVQRRGRAGSYFFEKEIALVDIAVDKGEISPSEGNVLRQHIGAYLAEAQGKEEKSIMDLAKKIATQAGITGDLELQDTAVQKQFKDIARAQLNLQVNVPPGGPAPAQPPFPGWIQGPGGIWGPPGGGGGAGAGGQGAAGPRPESEYEEQWVEYLRLRMELREALGLEPSPNQAARHAALLTENPDLNDPIFDDLKKVMGQLDIAKTYLFNWITRDVVELQTSYNTPNAPAAGWEVSEKSRKLLFEGLYEKLIGKPDQGAEYIHYKIGSFYVMDLLDKLESKASGKFDSDFFRHISELQHVRQIMHELNINLKVGEQYKEFIIKELSATGVDFVYNDIAGVSQVWAQIERVGGNMTSRGRSEWLSDADWKTIYREIDHIFDDSTNPANNQPNNPNRQILEEYVLDAQGQVVLDAQGNPVIRRLTSWEKDRAIKLAKILHAGLQRRGMYSFLGNLPPMAYGPGRIASTQDVYVGRNLMAKKQSVQFFPGMKDDGKLSTGEGSKALLEKIADIEIEEGGSNKNPDKRTLYLALFGIDPRVIVYDDNSSYDMMSHSWRSPKEFYDQIFITDPNGQHTTLLAYLSEQIRALDPTSADPNFGGGDLDGEVEINGVTRPRKTWLSQDVRDIVLGQRLYLSAFPRYGNFDTQLKTEVWRKISLLTPSTIATLLPNSINNQQVWEQMRAKLFAAEGSRVRQDTRRYFQHQSMAEMQNERADFEQIAGHDTLQNNQLIGPGNQILQHTAGIADAAAWGPQEFTQILHYMGLDSLDLPPAQGGLTPEEKDVLKGIIQTGLTRAHDLARAKMPFTFLIVDAPKISLKPSDRQYGGVSDADYIRLLASDQQTLAEGYNEGFNALIENPTKDPIGHYEKLLAGYARVHGRDSAFSATRSAVIAWHWMAAQGWKEEFIPLVALRQQILDQATSLMNKYFPGGRIAYNKEELKNSVLSWAQAGAWSKPEIDKIRREIKASPDWMFLFWLFTVVTILPPVQAEEFIKLIIPKIR